VADDEEKDERAEAKDQAGDDQEKDERAEAKDQADDAPKKKSEPKRTQRAAAKKADAVEGTPAGAAEMAGASPAIRKLARELGVDHREIPGTGDGGRVTEDDVKSYVRARLEELEEQGRGAEESAEPQLPDLSKWGEVQREPLGTVRRAIADSVTRSWRRIPHVTQHDRADITDLDSFFEQNAERAEKAGGKLTLTALLVKIAAEALKRFPEVNSAIDLQAGERIVRRYIHVGVAVDTEAGLLVPVLRDVGDRGLIDVAVELGRLAERARDRGLGPDELQGAGFTVTNLGGLGTTHFTPIVPWPQVAILGVGRARVEAVHRDGQFVPRNIVPLAISYDHRAIDGADAARFLRWIAEVLEEPLRLTMEP